MNKKYSILLISLILLMTAVLISGCWTDKDAGENDEELSIDEDLDKALDEEIDENDYEVDAIGEDEVEELGEMF